QLRRVQFAAAQLRFLCSAWLLAIATFGVRAQDERKPVWRDSPKEFKALTYRNIGPAAGGRVSRVAGIPGDPSVYFAATASGGVWTSADAGATWKSACYEQV